jgi:replicative DNA helicase
MEEAFMNEYVAPPTDKDLEQIVLACLIVDKYQINKFIYQIHREVFFFEDNRIIFDCLIEIYEQKKGADLMVLYYKLKEKKYLDRVGGHAYLLSITSRVSSAENCEIHIRKLQELYLSRNLIDICTKYSNKAFDYSYDSFDLVSEMKQDLDLSISNVVKSDIETAGKIHIENMKNAMHIQQNGIASGIKTHLRSVDKLTNGWQKSDLIILAGRPSMGKTAAAINLAVNSAIEEKKAIAIFSLEMSKSQLVGRIESMFSGIDVSKIIKKQLTQYDILTIEEKCRHLESAPIYIDDTAGISLIELKAKARRLYNEKGIELIVIDYLQLMKSGAKIGNREQEIAEISRGLKSLAKELNIPIIALSQLSRIVESRSDKKPMLSDLRESGQIEQDADMVIFCYRPEYYEIDSYEIDGIQLDANGLFMLIWAKHRNGELGEIPLKFIKHLTKLENYDVTTFHQEEPKYKEPMNSQPFKSDLGMNRQDIPF